MSKLLNEWPVVWRRFNPATETWSYHAEELKGLTCEPLYTAPPTRALRDHFAGLAMQGLMLGWNKMNDMYEYDVNVYTADRAYVIADAMLKARR